MAPFFNVISLLLIAILVFSAIQGGRRGASGSVRHLISMVSSGLLSIVAIVAAWYIVQGVSPWFHQWLLNKNVQIPVGEVGVWKQVYYTFVTGIRDFPLFRFSILFVIVYLILKQILFFIIGPIFERWQHIGGRPSHSSPTVISAVVGGLVGTVGGAVRGLIVLVVLFMYVTLFPQTQFATYIQNSTLYQKGAEQIIEPFTGKMLADNLPVITRAMEQDFKGLLQRKYEVLDANISSDIVKAAQEVAAKGKTDEEKAKLLYQWIGSRVQYDWDKVKLYEEKQIWKEQTPEDTFNTRKGVCIDYSRLYAAMARVVGLDAKVITGLGYDGKGGYGAHAWNEVYLKDSKAWIPLDSTWVSSGGNWFNPPNFEKTHIRDA
ncbi:transglutaminase domain-containing protein [Paenibacillus sp. KN14-4R]|uniref:transglutaminase domain-containing protein n=1 Tax=Paenibacillus sp. KN14-4R TaxID=3445773 RepID=UPI003FA0C367